MSDGRLVPLAHDGMGVFNMPDGKFRLVRNHEDRNGPGAGSVALDEHAYDARGGGGTTTLVDQPVHAAARADFVSLSGTIVNCAGGATPWESWITCEETTGGISAGWAKEHGYCFEVPASADGTVPAAPIPAMGRFSHEAVAVDPRHGIVYETEDNGPTSGFYRFIPNTPGVLANGGRLQMLAIDGRPNYDTQSDQTVGMALHGRLGGHREPDPAGTSSTRGVQSGR